MTITLFTMEGLQFVLRWIHFFSGVVWIGLLYYFNFIQGEWFKEIDATVKNTAVQKLVPRALLWFRYGALFTFLSGVLILSMKQSAVGHEIFSTSWGVFILTGSALATLMFLNVWLIIWPNQKVIIAKAQGQNVTADPAVCGAKAALASRTNTLFSIPMLFFMGAASHLPLSMDPEKSLMPLVLTLAIIFGLLELNAIKGKMGPLTTVRGVVHMGVLLTFVLYGIITVLV